MPWRLWFFFLGGWRTKSEEGKWNIFGDRRWRVLIWRSNSVGFSQSALISFSTTPQTRTGGVRFQKIKISQQPPQPTHAGLINSFSIHPESWVWSDSTFNGIRVFVQKKDKRRMVSCLRNLKERKSPILNFRTAWLIEVAAISSSEKAPLMIQHGPRTENQFTKEKLWDMREKKWMNNCATLRSN